MDDTFLKQKVDTPESRECCELSGEEEGKKINIYKTYDGRMVMGTHYRIDETGWCLLVEMGKEEIFAPVTALTHAILFILGVVLLLCTIFAILISRKITKPILTLHEAADQIIKGNLDHKAGTEARDEIGDMSRAFDSMTAELKESREELESYSKGLEEKVKERTKKLNQKAKESEKQKKAAINLLENVKKAKEELEKNTTELAEANKSLGLEITERKQAEKELQESEEKFRAVADSAQDALIMIDNNGNVLFWNASAEKNFGYAYPEVLGQNFHKLLAPKRFHQKYKKAFTVFQETGEGPAIGKTVELQAVRKSGEEFPVELSLSAIKLKGKWHSVGIVRDITERKQAEEELKKTNQELEKAIELANQMASRAKAANIAKSEFLANMSHEIRTPMNAVIGFTDMLLDSDLDDSQIDYAETIRSSGNALLSVINDILDFSKIEAGEMDFEEIDFDPKLLAYDVCELTHPRIGSKPVEILCRIGDRLPSYIKGDPSRFRQVLINLMGNSSKFTESGEIELSLDIEEEKGDHVKLHAAIRDTGIGIPKDKLSAIFSPFQQADGSTTRKYGGTGLGLSICKKISELMGGDVWAENAEDCRLSIVD
jgi:PAS domain S-box-containing protein